MHLSNHSSVADLLNPIILTITRVPKTLATERSSAFSQCHITVITYLQHTVKFKRLFVQLFKVILLGHIIV